MKLQMKFTKQHVQAISTISPTNCLTKFAIKWASDPKLIVSATACKRQRAAIVSHKRVFIILFHGERRTPLG